MNRNIILALIAALAVIVAGVTAYFLFFTSGGAPVPGGPQAPVAGEQNIGDISGGITASSGIPSGDTITIGSANGNVTVKNFYKTALGMIEDSQVILERNDAYEIDYSRADSAFFITVTGAPASASRAAAESKLLSLLGIGEKDVCRLKATVIISASADALTGGHAYTLGFCGGTAL